MWDLFKGNSASTSARKVDTVTKPAEKIPVKTSACNIMHFISNMDKDSPILETFDTSLFCNELIDASSVSKEWLWKRSWRLTRPLKVMK